MRPFSLSLARSRVRTPGPGLTTRGGGRHFTEERTPRRSPSRPLRIARDLRGVSSLGALPAPWPVPPRGHSEQQRSPSAPTAGSRLRSPAGGPGASGYPPRARPRRGEGPRSGPAPAGEQRSAHPHPAHPRPAEAGGPRRGDHPSGVCARVSAGCRCRWAGCSDGRPGSHGGVTRPSARPPSPAAAPRRRARLPVGCRPAAGTVTAGSPALTRGGGGRKRNPRPRRHRGQREHGAASAGPLCAFPALPTPRLPSRDTARPPAPPPAPTSPAREPLLPHLRRQRWPYRVPTSEGARRSPAAGTWQDAESPASLSRRHSPAPAPRVAASSPRERRRATTSF